MHTLDPLWLLLAGVGGGIAGSVAGLASLVSYPALLAVGIPAVTANMTNTVALVFSGVGSVWGSRPELQEPPTALRRLCLSALAGGLTGAALLLVTPARAFDLLVPWLVAAGSLGILVRRRTREAPRRAAPRRAGVLGLAVYLIALYGGYFGAAAGVVLLAVLLFATAENLARSNAVKNLLLGLANTVAAVTFVVVGPVRWSAALPLAVGFLAGGRVGPAIVRRVPAGPLRALIACGGLALAVHLGLDAYR